MIGNPQFKGVNINLPIACDLSTRWKQKNSKIPIGIFVLELDTGMIKIGIGKPYNETNYVTSEDPSSFTTEMKEMLTNANKANGVVVLDENGKLPKEIIDLDLIPTGDECIGKKAYEAAVIHGYKGTIEEWFAPLTNPSGYGDAVQTSDPVEVSFGNISYGEIIKGMTFSEFINRQYFPYKAPSFSSFNPIGYESVQEVGSVIPAGLTFSFSTDNNQNINSTFVIIDITNGSTVIANDVANSPVVTTSQEIVKFNRGTHIFDINGLTTNDLIFSKNFTFNFEWKMYYGESNLSSLVGEDILSLRMNELTNSYIGKYKFNPDGYKYICYPVDWGVATNFRDADTYFKVAMAEPIIVEVTNKNQVTCAYYVYRTVNKIASDFVLDVI